MKAANPIRAHTIASPTMMDDPANRDVIFQSTIFWESRADYFSGAEKFISRTARRQNMSYIPPKPHWDQPRPRSSTRHRRDTADQGKGRRHHKHSSSSSSSQQEMVVDYRAPPLALPTMECAVRGTQMSKERLLGILKENNLDSALIEPIWTDMWPDVGKHLFDPTTSLPRFALSTEVWKPVIKAYFAWYCIPREQCTHVWGDIVDMLLRLSRRMDVDAEFKVWAYGCLCKFYLEDRRRSKGLGLCLQYDPVSNWKT